MLLFVALIIEIAIGVNGWADTTGDISSPGVMIINIGMGGNGSKIEQIKIQHGICNPIRQVIQGVITAKRTQQIKTGSFRQRWTYFV